MEIHGVPIEDTFAEAFELRGTRLLITGASEDLARHAAVTMTGFATSIIGCKCEADIEGIVPPKETPDGRPGVSVLLFSMDRDTLQKQVETRVGQCVLTAPSAALFPGLEGERRMPLGARLRFFGDGFQSSKLIDGERYWRIPVMDGEFLCPDEVGVDKCVGGGNFIVLGRSREVALNACRAANEAIAAIPGAIAPFPGGVVRSGSKVGSRYKGLMASTNDAFCPSLRGLTDSQLPDDVTTGLEVVIDGLTDDAVRAAMAAGIRATAEHGRGGIARITAGNYGGSLGKYHYPLHEVLA